MNQNKIQIEIERLQKLFNFFHKEWEKAEATKDLNAMEQFDTIATDIEEAIHKLQKANKMLEYRRKNSFSE